MTRVAAQVAAWQRRARNQPGPWAAQTAPTGDAPTGGPIQVELFVDGTWIDITSYVMTRDGNVRVDITRGKPDQAQKTNPGVCRFQLNNRDGRFSPRNPLGPYFGFLGRNQPLRVSVPSGNDKATRFFGEVPAWPQQWDPTGTDVWVPVEAAGILRRLGQGSPRVGSTLTTQLSTGFTFNAGSTVVAYWPCEDALGATVAASGLSGQSAMAVKGTPTFGSYTGFAGSAALPTFTAGSQLAGQVATYTALAATMVRFLAVVPAGGLPDNTVLCSIYTTGTVARWDIFYAAAGTGTIGLSGYNSLGVLVTTVAAFGSNLAGNPAGLSFQMAQSGADVAVSFGSAIIPLATSYVGSGTASGQTAGLVRSVVLGPNLGLTNTVVGQVVVETSANTTFDPDELDTDILARAGERSDTRISRMCGLIGIGYERIGDVFDFSNLLNLVAVMGAQPITTALDVIDQCVAADDGILYESLVQIGLGFRTRASLENQAAVVTLDYPSFQLAKVPTPQDDDRYTRNDVTVSRSGGSSYPVVQKDGPLSIAQPPAGVGTYQDSVTLNVHQDSDLPDQAGWRLHLGTVDEARYPVVAVNLAHASFVSNPALRRQVLSVRLGDRIVITNPPSWLPPDAVSQLVVGFSESIDHFQHQIQFVCVPESPYETARLGDAVLSRIDTAGSQMAVAAQPADTTLTVATTSGPVWTTSAGDFPFDAKIAGERVTVTNITGSTSPQTFTVVRSVNGVVKTLPVGADVRLYQPTILAL